MWPISGLGGLFHADFWSRVKYSIHQWKEHAFASCLGDEQHNSKRIWRYRPKSGNCRLFSTHRHFCRSVRWLGSLSHEEDVRCGEARIRLAQKRVRLAEERIRFRERAFFIESLKKHYRDLNEQVFRPLARLELVKTTNHLSICTQGRTDYSLVPYDPFASFLWPSAEKHILKEPYEELRAMPKLIWELQKRINAYNAQVSTLTGVPFTDVMNAITDKSKVSPSALETDLQLIKVDVKDIQFWFSRLSDSIEYDQYDVKADCCPTGV